MDQALLVEVRTYGFLHVGIEPLRREVLKRSWGLLAGSTLYGAIQAALMRLYGPNGAKPQMVLDALCRPSVEGGPTLRFMPLLPDNRSTIQSGWDYCMQAERLADLEAGAVTRLPHDPGYQTTPHAPLNRRNAQIHGSLLFAIECHQPEQIYRGWILCTDEVAPVLEQGLAMLPFLPLGGKGKFTNAEAQIVARRPTVQLCSDLGQAMHDACDKNDMATGLIEVEMVTPLVFQGVDLGLMQEAQRWQPKPPRRYRVWRTGYYPNAIEGGRRFYGQPLADETPAAKPPMAWSPDASGYALGQPSQAVAALPDGSRFSFGQDKIEALAEAFFTGTGRVDWAALGWGQLFFRRPTSFNKEAADG